MPISARPIPFIIIASSSSSSSSTSSSSSLSRLFYPRAARVAVHPCSPHRRGGASRDAPPTRPPTMAAHAISETEPGSRAPPLASEAEWKEYHARWDGIWRNGCAPGQFFDKGSASPTLRSLLSLPLLPAQAAHLAASPVDNDGSYVPPPRVDARGKRALVPGCGRGYDVIAFAQAGASAAVGLELSPVAAQVAREFVAAELGKGEAAMLQAARVVEGDFFDPPSADDEDGAVAPASFDLGYDLTFLCALHPSMREAWARGWARLLKRGALLVTACYPVDPSRNQDAGPPWPLTPGLYERLLLGDKQEGGGKEEARLFRKVYLAPVPAGMSHPERAGKEWLGIWERL